MLELERVYHSAQTSKIDPPHREALTTMISSTPPRSGEPPSNLKPLRLWPGVVAVILVGLVRFAVPALMPEAAGVGVIGALVGGLIILVWWVFFSRAPWAERIGAVVLMAVALFATSLVVHESIATGMMGLLLLIYAVPLACVALVTWAVFSRHLSMGARRLALVVTITLACSVWTLVRTNGLTGSADSDFTWRWAKTHEDRLLVEIGKAPARPPSALVKPATEAVWPGFRGAARDGIIRDTRIQTNWAKSPPFELWRRAVGPGWSSFAVNGNLLYTQEQRGEEEIVACYNLKTGEPVWKHSDPARFWESNAGAGPRGTPTLSGDRVYTFGATGIVNALNAGDGTVIWTRNAATDTGAKLPGWGFASSPLVVDDIVVVAAAGVLVGYNSANGQPRWIGPPDRDGYSSPHLLKTGNVEQIILLSSAGATGVAPADGAVLWEHSVPGFPMIVQPALIENSDVFIGSDKMFSRLRVSSTDAGKNWIVEERWKTNRLKPYFNDFVVHEGHAFGFDSGVLACVDIEDGGRKWKGGRYGRGQLVLLADQDLLLVLSEQGELALVSAVNDQFAELARFPAIKGKTWNHPVLVGDILLVRNDQEMAAFRLGMAEGKIAQTGGP